MSSAVEIEVPVRWSPGTLVQWGETRERGVVVEFKEGIGKADDGGDLPHYVIVREDEQEAYVDADKVAPAFDSRLAALPLSDGTLVRVGDRIRWTSGMANVEVREGTVFGLRPRQKQTDDPAKSWKENNESGLLDLAYSGLDVRMEGGSDFVEQFVSKANFRGDSVQTGAGLTAQKIEETPEQMLRRELDLAEREASSLTRAVNGLLARKDDVLRKRQDLIENLRERGASVE